MDKLNDDYKKELKDLETRMIKAQEFAKKIPIFSKIILANKITGEEKWQKFQEGYKTLSLSWGVSRGFFEKGTIREITNCWENYSGYFWTVYINTLSEYDGYNSYGLSEVKPCYHLDSINSTFYCTDDQIEELLENLNNWKIKAVELNKKDQLEEKIKALTEQLNRLKQKEEKLNNG